MKIEQFVTAYRVDHDKVKALLSDDYESLRPVLRINIEIIHDEGKGDYVRIEHNTPVASKGKRGWLNIMLWEGSKTQIDYTVVNKHFGEPTPGMDDKTKGMTTVFKTEFLNIEFTGVGIEGGCPAESDNEGCFYIIDGITNFVPSEINVAHKEYCDCEVYWIRKLNDAMSISVEEILGAYKLSFER